MFHRSRWLILLVVLALVLAACGGDGDKDDKDDNSAGSAAALTQDFSYFDGGLAFKLPEGARVEDAGAASRFISFVLESGAAGYIVWGPQDPQYPTPADAVQQPNVVNNTELGEITSFELNGNPAARVETDATQSGQGQGYMLVVYVGDQGLNVSILAQEKFDDQKATMAAILDSFSVDAEKFTAATSG